MKNKVKIYKRCNYREWPIRRQLMFSFLCTTVLLQVILITVIFGNIEFMITSTNSQIYTKINDNSNHEFNEVANQIGVSFQSHLYFLSTQLGTVIDIFSELFNPILQYTPSNSYQNCEILKQVNYFQVCFYSQENTIPLYKLDYTSQQIIGQIQNYQQYLPLLFVESVKTKISRLSILVLNRKKNIETYMIYPSNQILKYSVPRREQSNIQLQGPYINPTNNSNIIMNLQRYLSYQNYSIYFTIEFEVSSLESLFTSINYYQTTMLAITDKRETFIYAPKNWSVNYSTSIQKIYNYPSLSGFNISRIPITNVSVLNIYNETYRLVRLNFSGSFNSTQLSSFINNYNNNTDFYVYLYVLEASLLTAYTLINGIMERVDTAIIYINISSTVFTIALVFIFTYTIAVRISRPLNRLVAAAKYMSNNVTKKNITEEILNEIRHIEAANQIQELIVKFKILVESIKKKNNSKQSMVKKNIVQYPLNQYDPEFINKTKNKTDINWTAVINEIDE